MTQIIILVIVVVLAMSLIRRYRNKKMVISSPRLGIIDYIGEAGSAMVTGDIGFLNNIFGKAVNSINSVPECDVLFVYCEINKDGTIKQSPLKLREIIQASHATIVVIASENEGDNYIAAVKAAGQGQANLVMTLQRQGDSFSGFYNKLFGLMFKGVPMPVAWNEIAPQIPNSEHQGIPDSIFVCERGQVTFSE